MYSGRLALVGDLLQGLFREAYALQRCLMELLDKISLESSASEEGTSDVVAGVFVSGRSSHLHAYSLHALYFIPDLPTRVWDSSFALFSKVSAFLCSDSQCAGHMLSHI